MSFAKVVVIASVVQGALALADPDPHSTDAHASYKQHMDYIKANGIMPIMLNSTGLESSSGSFVTTVYTTMTCQKNTEYTATGTTLGSCISASDTASYRYTSCSVQGSKTVVGMTSCTSGDCESGCSSYSIPFDTGCQTMSMMTCSSANEPWEDYNFDYHALMYWGSDNCGGNYDMWTAVDTGVDDCDDIGCYTYDQDGSKYSMEGFCD